MSETSGVESQTLEHVFYEDAALDNLLVGVELLVV
jgi:hypothetical protein